MQREDAPPATDKRALAVEIATRTAPNAPDRGREPRLAICLSGGGYRAMLFHVGALRRLNEFGMLRVVDRFSSVSGGSVVAAVLATRWNELDFDTPGVARRFDIVERALFDLASRTLDWSAGLLGILPGTNGAAQLTRQYRRHLFPEFTLQDLPEEPPRFVFNTTNMKTGNLFRWSRPYGADYGLGRIDQPDLGLAEVVAASSAFPPFLSPLRLSTPGPVVDHATQEPIADQPRELCLTDGGVYDNLGLQPAESFHTVLASDGGAPFDYAANLRSNWLSQSLRATFLVDSQVRRLRRRHLVHELIRGERLGTLWTIATAIDDYGAVGHLPCPPEATDELANLPTRLAALPAETRKRLINWGYASADAAVRGYVEPALPVPSEFPFPCGV